MFCQGVNFTCKSGVSFNYKSTANHTTSKTYDEEGNLKTVTDRNGNITTYEYDELHRLTEVKNARKEITSYTYDGNGNLLTQTDDNGNTTTYRQNLLHGTGMTITETSLQP